MRQCNLDLAFVVDESGSLSASEWDYAKSSLQAIMVGMDVGYVKMAAVTYTGTARARLYLNEFLSVAGYTGWVDQLSYSGGTVANLTGALWTARTQFFSGLHGDSSESPDAVLLLTHQLPTVGQDTLAAELAAYTRRGIKRFVFSVGGAIPSDLLETVGSKPREDFVYSVDTFSQLNSLVNPFLAQLCPLTRV